MQHEKDNRLLYPSVKDRLICQCMALEISYFSIHDNIGVNPGCIGSHNPPEF